MGFTLGLDGKKRAVKTNTSANPPEITTFYVGLLETLPADYDGLSFYDLVVGNEFVPSANFYTGGRKAITFNSTPTGDKNGAGTPNLIAVSWDNTTGGVVPVEGAFITDTQSGTSGLSLWVGPPDIGTMNIADGDPALIDVGSLFAAVD